MSKSDYYRAWILGVICGMSFLSLFYMVNIALDSKPQEPQKSQSNFEVVDKYKSCEVVRWTQSYLAEYKYFLDCRVSN
jgi:hypothetical protein